MNRLMRRATVGMAVLAGVLATGCGGTTGTADRTDAPAASEPPAATTSPTAAPSPEPTGPVVTMKFNQFFPEEPAFPSGTEVTVINEGNQPHTFTIPDADIDVLVEAGQTANVMLDMKPGSYLLVCTLHQGMERDLTITS